MTRNLKAMTPVIEDAAAYAVAALYSLSKRHYRYVDLSVLLAKADTPLDRNQFSRLLGVMIKEPFAYECSRPPSSSTHAVFALDWKDNASVGQIAPTTWQFPFIRALINEEKRAGQLISARDVIAEFTCCKHETNLGKFILQSLRNRICCNKIISKGIKQTSGAAKKAGVNPTNATPTKILVGLAATVAFVVESILPPSIASVGTLAIGAIALGRDGRILCVEFQLAEKSENQESISSLSEKQ